MEQEGDMMNQQYITIENASAFEGKTVDCRNRAGHCYPLTVIRGVNTGRYYIVDRNAVAMPINQNDNIPFDFIVEEE